MLSVINLVLFELEGDSLFVIILIIGNKDQYENLRVLNAKRGLQKNIFLDLSTEML